MLVCALKAHQHGYYCVVTKCSCESLLKVSLY